MQQTVSYSQGFNFDMLTFFSDCNLVLAKFSYRIYITIGLDFNRIMVCHKGIFFIPQFTFFTKNTYCFTFRIFRRCSLLITCFKQLFKVNIEVVYIDSRFRNIYR